MGLLNRQVRIKHKEDHNISPIAILQNQLTFFGIIMRKPG